MTKPLTRLLLSVMLVFALTACGDDDRADSGVTDGGTTGNGALDTLPGENGAAGETPGVTDGLDGMDGTTGTDGVTGTGGMDGATGTGGMDGATGADTAAGGVSYEQMLRNARVHDTDGDLTDYENASVSRWTA